MPIHRLLSTSVTGMDGLPRLGKLRKGAAKEQGKAPRDLTYFRMTFDKDFEFLQPAWDRMYGKAPEFFDPVYVAGATADEAFSTYMEDWTATTLLRRCDSIAQIRHYQPDTDSWSDEPIACAQAVEGCSCQCKQVGRLNLIFLDFMRETGALGYVTVETHSINDIATMYKRLKAYEGMFGTLQGVQFRFGRAAQEISRPADRKTGKRGRMTKSLFFLNVSSDYVKNEVFSLMSGARPAALLPAVHAGFTAEQKQAAARRLGNNGDRRIGELPEKRGNPEPPLPDTQEPDFEEGDYEEAPAFPVGPQWSENEAKTFAAWLTKNTLSAQDGQNALGVKRWGEWQGSLDEAYQAVDAWLAEQHGADA